MNESWDLSIYWCPRSESASYLSNRLQRFLEMASAISANLGYWYTTGPKRQSSRGKPINEYDLNALERLIEKNTTRNDVGTPVDFGGYTLGLWNGQREDAFAHIRIAAGRNKSPGADYKANYVSLSLQPNLAVHDLGNDDALKQYISTLILAWEPGWAVLYRYGSPGYKAKPEKGPFLDKMAWAGPPFLAQAASLSEDGVTVDVLAGGALYTRLNPPAIPPANP
jgi:hypothetical protein